MNENEELSNSAPGSFAEESAASGAQVSMGRAAGADPPDSNPRKRQWNGYGLSFWSCRCGARRHVSSLVVRGDRIAQIIATPCKRCGDESEPVGWPSDPWQGFSE